MKWKPPELWSLNEMYFRNISNLKTSLFFKNTYTTHQIQFSFARRDGSQTLFLWQNYCKSKTILLISGVQPKLPCWQDLSLQKHLGEKNLHFCPYFLCRTTWDGTGEQQNQDFLDAVEVSAHLPGVEPAASPLQNISSRTLVPNPTPVPLNPLPAALTHLCTGKATLSVCSVGCSQQKFGDESQGQRDECIFYFTEQA